jgi:hypothetical protein
MGSSGSQAVMRLASSGRRTASMPQTSIEPLDGGNSPATMRNVVVLPAPLGPNRA